MQDTQMEKIDSMNYHVLCRGEVHSACITFCRQGCMSVQLITENRKRPKRFTPQQKLQILKEWELSGNGIEVARKYQIHPHTQY